jgi:hypothetical protein
MTYKVFSVANKQVWMLKQKLRGRPRIDLAVVLDFPSLWPGGRRLVIMFAFTSSSVMIRAGTERTKSSFLNYL